VKKQLLAGGEDEVLPAIHAFKYLVLEFHDPVACRRTTWPATPALLENRTDLPGPGHRSGLLQLQLAFGGGKGRLAKDLNPTSAVIRTEDTEGPRLSYTSLRARGN
jgi:hypothetical protein